MEGEPMLGRNAIAMQFVLPYCGWRELLALEQVCATLFSWVQDPWLWRHLAIEPPLSYSMSETSILRLVKRANGNLITLKVAHNPHLTVATIECVLDACPHLEELVVPHSPRVIVCHVIDTILARSQRAPSTPSHCNKTSRLAATEGHLFVNCHPVLCDDGALHTIAALPPRLRLHRLELRGCNGTREEDDDKPTRDVNLSVKFSLMCNIMRSERRPRRGEEGVKVPRSHTEMHRRDISIAGRSEVMDGDLHMGEEDVITAFGGLMYDNVESHDVRRQLLPHYVKEGERKEHDFAKMKNGAGYVDVDVGICSYCAHLRILYDEPKTVKESASITKSLTTSHRSNTKSLSNWERGVSYAELYDGGCTATGVYILPSLLRVLLTEDEPQTLYAIAVRLLCVLPVPDSFNLWAL